MKTAESVTPAHPDKVCDQISDAVLDAALAVDPGARVAIEVVGGHGLLTVTGELSCSEPIDIRAVAEAAYQRAGYQDRIGITINVVAQSQEISRGVDAAGAGDQGVMLGYATAETAAGIPLELLLARRLTKAMGLRDGKAQVTTEGGRVVRILTSVCEHPDISDDALENEVQDILREYGTAPASGDANVWLRNPNGRWTIGGFAADTGLTGRKLAVDNYGPGVPLGGGCFSGKDASKVDRSGAYMARRIACDYLKRTGAREVYVSVAYAIGLPEPVMAIATIDGSDEPVVGYDLRPRAIRELLDLARPQYEQTARHGHFGNGFSWG